MIIRTLAPLSLVLALTACDPPMLAPCPVGSMRVGDTCRGAPRDAGAAPIEADGGFEVPDAHDEPDAPDAALAPDAPDAGPPCTEESCNATDDDCDGAIDEGVTTTFFADADGDGFGVEGTTAIACEVPVGFAALAGDCDDACPSCHPGGTEVCDDLDQDCDGDAIEDALRETYYVDGDGDGYSPRPEGSMRLCAAAPGWTARPPAPGARDCADADPRAFPTQAGYFTDEVVGAAGAIGRWDFDCSGAIEGRYARGGTCDTGIACSGRTGVFVGTAVVGCGAAAPFQESCGRVVEGGMLVCRSVVTSVTQSCH